MIASAILAMCLGVLIGYTRWGTTASIVELVERQLTETQERINVLEKRIESIEGRIVSDKADNSSLSKSPLDPSAARQTAAANGDLPVEKPKQ
jgi:hypothetical protein